MLIVILLILGISSASASEFKFVVPVEVGESSRGAILIEAPKKYRSQKLKKSKVRKPAAAASQTSKKPRSKPN